MLTILLVIIMYCTVCCHNGLSLFVQITPVSARRTQILTLRPLTRRHSDDAPQFIPPPPPPPPQQPPPPDSPSDSPSDSPGTMDTRSENRLDVSGCSDGTLTNSTSTEAMLKDLRKLNPTYTSDLSMNKQLSVDPGALSPAYSGGSKSPTSKRWV